MSRMPNDDLFEGTTMTFGEHLEELRMCLFRALIGVVLGTVLGLLVAHLIVQAIQDPLKSALDRYYLDKATEELAAQYRDNTPPEVLALIQQEGLIPGSMRLEAAGVIELLRRAAPEEFGQINYTPHRFVAADIRNADFTGLCRRLVEAGETGGHGPVALLWQLLSDAQRQTARRLAKQDSVDNNDVAAVVAMLNDLTEKAEIPFADEFKTVDGSFHRHLSPLNPIEGLSRLAGSHDLLDEAAVRTVRQLRTQLEQHSGRDQRRAEADQLRRLNRLLIASALPDWIRPPRKLLIDVPIWKPTDVRVQTLNAQEAFMIWLKAALLAGFVISSPWVFWQIWTFVAAGLYPHEKRYVYIYLPFSLTLFLAGTALAFFFVFEPVLNFLFSFNKMLDIDPDPRISEWLSFVLFLPLGFGIAFQLPLVMLFLNRIGIFDVEAYLEKWRISILVIFVLSMLLTPADPISMLLMAFPLTFLYFLGIGLCQWMPRVQNPFREAYEP